MTIRPYEAARDRDHVIRIWREIGWLPPDRKKADRQFDAYIVAPRTLVAELDGAAECAVMVDDGTIRYQAGELPFAGVAGVATSRVARRRGLASRTTAAALANAAARGLAVAGLGIFDQGFYNQLGFGSLAYQHRVTFDPATLRIDRRPRPPERLTLDDAAEAHRARRRRLRPHGGVNFEHPAVTGAAMQVTEEGFGLGYRENGRLTHYFWAQAKGESGPYRVHWMVYRDAGELLELLGLLHQLSDQVQTVRLDEPPPIQLQDLLDRPFRNYERSRRAEHEHGVRSEANYQARVLDLPACVAAVEAHAEVAFNLELTDPIAAYLPAGGWRGAGGSYLVRLGARSTATPGSDPRLPTLRAAVGAFSRVWLGARPAGAVAITDQLTAPPDLLAALDRALALPPAQFDWTF